MTRPTLVVACLLAGYAGRFASSQSPRGGVTRLGAADAYGPGITAVSAGAGGRPGRFGRHTQGVLAGRGFGRGDERERGACPAAGDEARVPERQGGARGAPRGAGGEACGELGGVLCGNEITNRDVAQRRNTKT